MPHRTMTPAKHAQQFTHEHVKFPDGSHVIVHSSPGRVQVTGYLDGEWIEYAGSARDAEEQARLLRAGAPDALWTTSTDQAARIASAIDGATSAATVDAIPWADSPEDVDERPSAVTTHAVNLDGDGVAYIEHIENRVELTVKMRGRLNVALTMSTSEAAEIGQALARPDGPTLSDLFAVSDAMNADASTLARTWGTAAECA